MARSTIITWRQVFKSLSEGREIEALAVPKSLAHLALLNTLSATVSNGLGKLEIFIHALVAGDSSSSTGTGFLGEPFEVANRTSHRVLHALDTLLLVFHRVEAEGGVGVTTNNVENELTEVATFVVFLIEHTNEGLEIRKRISARLGNVEGDDETVALLHAEHEAILPHAARVPANAGGIVVSAESTALFESLLFKQPEAVNFRNTVFAHFL